MKRIVSILLVAIVLLAMSTVTIFAENQFPGEYIYQERFKEEYAMWIVSQGDFYYYSERYYHHVDENDPNSEIDWILVYGNINWEEMHYSTVIGNRVYVGSHGFPFSTGYAVYDVKQDCFVNLTNSQPFEDYEDLEDVINNKVRIGELLGDTDSDERLTILDATTLQIGLVEGKYRDRFSEGFFVADFDFDDKVTVMDATAIQMKLAMVPEEPLD